MQNLATEIKTYNSRLPDLLAHQGKFVLIKGEQIVSIFDSYQDALQAGYDKYGLESFLVKAISPAEQVSFFTRNVVAQCQA